MTTEKSRNKRLDRVRLTEAEDALIEDAAQLAHELRGQNKSSWVRAVLLEAARHEIRKAKK